MEYSWRGGKSYVLDLGISFQVRVAFLPEEELGMLIVYELRIVDTFDLDVVAEDIAEPRPTSSQIIGAVT
jgi:hypothetical protein